MAGYNLSPSFAPGFDLYTNALSMLESKLLEDMQVELDDPTIWQKMATMNPGMTPRELEEQFYAILAEHDAVMAGHVLVPDYINYGIQHGPGAIQQYVPSSEKEPAMLDLIASLKQALPERSTTKGVNWSNEEHRLFLLGLDFHGKGDWNSISKNFVLSRTPSQIANHAKKFFIRNGQYRSSIHHNFAMATQAQHPMGDNQNVFNYEGIN